MQYKEIQSTEIRTFQLEDEPEVLHIIKSGFEGQYFCFYENAYETEPWHSGVQLLDKEQIQEKWKINLFISN
jgi:hypothetical protein